MKLNDDVVLFDSIDVLLREVGSALQVSSVEGQALMEDPTARTMRSGWSLFTPGPRW